jgi:hypothetical protein
MSLRLLSAEELQILAPAIREAWRTDNRNVFLALCIKDSIRQGMGPDVTVASTCVIIREWLDAYLGKNHAAMLRTTDGLGLIVSFLRESVNLAGVLP